MSQAWFASHSATPQEAPKSAHWEDSVRVGLLPLSFCRGPLHQGPHGALEAWDS